jgi:hypothetical protein
MVLGKSAGVKKLKGSDGSSSSRHVHHQFTSRLFSGRLIAKQESLNAISIKKRQSKDRDEHHIRLAAMTTTELDELIAIREGLASNGDLDGGIDQDGWGMDIDGVLAGDMVVDISHAGDEFASVVDLAEDMFGSWTR